MILFDAGPLVALIHADDQHHRVCDDVAKRLREPLATVWPVLAEAMYLLGFSWKAQDALWEMLDNGYIELLAVEREDLSRMRALMGKFRDLPMDLADAALVAVAERLKLRRIFTVDRSDFQLYRPAKMGRFVIIP